MVLRVRPTPTRFPTNSLYTPMDNTPLHSRSSVCHPWGNSCRRPHSCYRERSQGVTQLSHTGVTQLSHTGVTGNTTATCRGHRGSHNCHTQESQAVAQLLHGEVTGVTQREENNRLNIHHKGRPVLFRHLQGNQEKTSFPHFQGRFRDFMAIGD